MTSDTEIPVKSTVLWLFRPFVTGATSVVIGATILTACVSGSTDSVLPSQPDTATAQPDAATSQPDDGLAVATAVRPDGAGLAISVTRVSDGDSLRANSAEGELEIRLLGVNAPETDECFGPQAAASLEALLEGTDVTLHPWPGDTDEFGRQLGFLQANDIFVNLALVQTGNVVARAQSNHGFEAEFETAERQANEQARGLWAPDACGTPSDAELRIIEVFENAPGDDRENPNGEFVVIVNNGDAELSLDGWTLRDESTRHRFSFPPVIAPPNIEIVIRTGCGNDTPDADPIELFWCDPEPPVWNNGGDTAFLLDPSGAIVDNLVIEGS